MSEEFKVVIPARYASLRLPGKPLREIAGKAMVLHVLDRARESQAQEVLVATDDKRILAIVEAAGGQACMTRSDHFSGSDRIAEVAERRAWSDATIIVNLQGDEPCMPAELIDQVARDMASHQSAQVTTLSAPIRLRETLFDPHVVKVVTDAEGYALYFSRAPIPWHRDEFMAQRSQLPDGVPFQRHIGLYAYRAGFLKRYVAHRPAPLETAETLEQLRVLWYGGRIHVSQASKEPAQGVDTLEDLRRTERALSGG